MKRYQVILGTVIIAAITYLVLAFVEFKWCPVYWSGLSRLILLIAALICGLLIFASGKPKVELGE